MGGLDIVGLGLSTLDVLVRLEAMPTWERPGGMSGFAVDGGGMVGTAMVAAARLGARVGYIGVAGNDTAAGLKLLSFRQNNVDISRLIVRDRPEKHVVLVYVHEESGERVFMGYNRFAEDKLQPAELDRAYITSAAYLHLDGSHSETAMQAARWMHEAGKLVSLDASKTSSGPAPEHLARLVPNVDVLICGSGFGQALTGERDLWRAGGAMLRMGPQIVVQTEGADGSYTVTADSYFHTPAFPVQVVDTTGAGDVFHGAYLVGLLRGWDLRTVALFATAASAIECTQLGGRSGVPTFAEVAAFLSQRAIVLPA